MSIDLTRFYDTFFSECFNLIDEAESLFIAIEKGDANSDTLNAAFRSIHSIKGSAGSLGFDSIAAFAHEFENALDALRDGAVRPGPEDSDLLLACLDTLRVMLEAAKREAPGIDASRLSALTQRLQKLAGGLTDRDETLAELVEPEQSSGAGLDKSTPGLNHFNIHFKPLRAALDCGHDPIRYLIAVAQLGEARFTPLSEGLPDSASYDPQQAYLGWRIELTTERDRAELIELFEWIEDLCELEIARDDGLAEAPRATPLVADIGLLTQPADNEPSVAEQSHIAASTVVHGANHGAGRSTAPPNGAVQTGRRAQAGLAGVRDSVGGAVPASAALTHQSSSIHVKSERLDLLMNLLGEMLISHSRVRALCERLGHEESHEILAQLGALERSTASLQDVILSVRMIPIATLFGRFERLVRDAARALGKEVHLVSDSHGAELDNGLVERMIDPLTHLIRNAIDHGLESAEERLARAKPAAGRLELTASYSSGRVQIEIRDDGRGVDVERIRARAIERGLARPEEVKSDQEWMRHIFQPGFSTASQVSTWSGRGVGLDVALNAVQSVGGQIVMESKPNMGTVFKITLPLTTSIMDALIVRADGRRYAVPVTSVQHCLRADPGALERLPNGAQAYRLNNRYLSFTRLSEVLGLSASSGDIRTDSVALLVHAHAEPVVMLVDAIEAQQQIVVKDVTHQSYRSPLTIGATVLGDGQVALILDLNAIESVLIRKSRSSAATTDQEPAYA